MMMDDLVKKGGLFGTDFEVGSLGEENKILKEKLQFIEVMLDSIKAHIYLKNEKGCYLWCNKARHCYIGAEMNEILYKNDEDIQDSMISDLKITYNPYLFLPSGEDVLFERHQIGMLERKFKLYRSTLKDNRKIVGILGVSFDISSELELLNQANFESSNTKYQLQQVINSIDAPIYWKNVSGRYLGCNRSTAIFHKVKGVEDIIGLSDKQLLSVEMEKVARENDISVMSKRKSADYEEVCTDGREIIFLSRKSPLLNLKGDVSGVIGISIDITERKKLERETERQNILLKKQDQLKTQFIRNFSHDLSAPISSLKNDFILLQSLIKSDVKIQKLVGRFIRNLDRIETMFLDMRREFLSGVWDVNIREQNFCLSNMLNREFDLLKSFLTIEKSEKLVLKLAIDQAIPAQITGDSVKLGMILRNLLANAIKYTNEGYVELAVELIEKIEHDEDRTATLWLSFAIVDTGIGIPEEHLSDIFCMGFRVNSSYDANGAPGSGLGLSIVKDYVDLLKGEIIVESSLGKGSKFLVKLSFSSVDDKENHENT